MQSWLPLLAIAIFFWGMYDILYNYVSKYLSVFSANVIFALIQFLVFAPFVWFAYAGQKLELPQRGVILAIVMGLLLSVGNLAFFWAFQRNAPVSVAVPAMAVGLFLMGSLWGVFILHEPVTLGYILGVILALAGVILITARS